MYHLMHWETGRGCWANMVLLLNGFVTMRLPPRFSPILPEITDILGLFCITNWLFPLI